MNTAQQLDMGMVKLAWKGVCERHYPGFVEDSDNSDVIYLLQLWMARHPEFEKAVAGEHYSLNKGICLHGPVGTGKTDLMRIMQLVLKQLGSPLQFAIYPMRTLCADVEKAGVEILHHQRRHWMVDELGLVKREAVFHYKNEYNVGEELIGVRDDLFKQGYMLHITTNLVKKDLLGETNDFGVFVPGVYTARTASRIAGLCNLIPMEGRDRRKDAKPANLVVHPNTVKEVDKDEVERNWWKMILRQYEQFKEHGTLEILSATRQWKRFEEVGLVSLKDADKQAYMAKAKQAVVDMPAQAEKGILLDKAAQRERQDIKLLKEAVATGVFTEEQQMRLRNKAAQLAIADFYSWADDKDFRKKVVELIEKKVVKL